jgi:hypothetical protein
MSTRTSHRRGVRRSPRSTPPPRRRPRPPPPPTPTPSLFSPSPRGPHSAASLSSRRRRLRRRTVPGLPLALSPPAALARPRPSSAAAATGPRPRGIGGSSRRQGPEDGRGAGRLHRRRRGGDLVAPHPSAAASAHRPGSSLRGTHASTTSKVCWKPSNLPVL